MRRYVLLISLGLLLCLSRSSLAQPSVLLADPGNPSPGQTNWLITSNSPTAPLTNSLGDPGRGDGNNGDAVYYIDGQIRDYSDGAPLATSAGAFSLENTISTFIGGENTFVVSTTDTSPTAGAGEQSQPHSFGYFPYAGGWTAGVVDQFGSLSQGNIGSATVSNPATGQFDFTGLGPGNLLATAVGNGTDYLLGSTYNSASDTWSVFVNDNNFPDAVPTNSPGGGENSDGLMFSFVHFAPDAPGVIAGEFAADGSVSNLSDAATSAGVSVNRTGTGNYQLTVGDGSTFNPDTAAIFYTNAGGGDDSDNFLTFNSDAQVGDSFNAVVWEAPHQQLGVGNEAVDGPVRFAIVPFDSTQADPAPGVAGPDASIGFIDDGAPQPTDVPWSIRSNSSPIPFTDVGGDPTSGDGNRGDAVFYVDGAPVTFADGAPIVTTGGSLSQENTISTFIGGEGTFVISTTDTEPDGSTSEESQSHSLAYFPYADGWTAGRVDGSGTLLDGTLPAGASFSNVATGTYEIAGLGPGHLMTSAVGNGEDDLLSSVYDPASDIWTVFLHDNAVPDAVLANGDFSFVHFAPSAGDVFAGEIAADGTLSNLSDAAAALGVTISQLDTGSYEIVIGDGSQINPDTAALFLSAAGVGEDADNFVSFNSQAFNGNAFNAFVWEAPELQLGVGNEAVNGPLRFVIIPFDTTNVTPLTEGTSPGVIPEPSSLALLGAFGLLAGIRRFGRRS